MTNHKCSINQIESADSMEASDLKECFETSVKTNKLIHKNYNANGYSNLLMTLFKLVFIKVLLLMNLSVLDIFKNG